MLKERGIESGEKLWDSNPEYLSDAFTTKALGPTAHGRGATCTQAVYNWIVWRPQPNSDSFSPLLMGRPT